MLYQAHKFPIKIYGIIKDTLREKKNKITSFLIYQLELFSKEMEIV